MATKVGSKSVDPMRKFRFEVETLTGGHIPAGRVGFTEVSGLNLGTTEVISYVDGNDVTPRKLPGRTTFSDITLKKGMDAGRHLATWREIVMESLSDEADFAGVPVSDVNELGQREDAFRADLLITLYDRSSASGSNPGRKRAAWIVRGAWPTAMPIEALTAEGGVLMEECTFATERIVQIFPKRGANA